VSWIFTTILNWLGGGVLDRVLGHLEAKAKSDTERLRIVTVRDQHAMTTQARVVTAGMAHERLRLVGAGRVAERVLHGRRRCCGNHHRAGNTTTLSSGTPGRLERPDAPSHNRQVRRQS
jgi:hypothetical protein